MEVVELNQAEQAPVQTVCEQPLEPVPEEVAEPVAVAAPEQVEEAQPKPKRKVGRPKGYTPPNVKLERVSQEERVLEELGHTKKQIDTLKHAEV